MNKQTKRTMARIEDLQALIAGELIERARKYLRGEQHSVTYKEQGYRPGYWNGGTRTTIKIRVHGS